MEWFAAWLRLPRILPTRRSLISLTVQARRHEDQRVTPMAGSMLTLECVEGLVEVARVGVRMGLRAESFAESAHHALAPAWNLGLAERAARAKEPAPQVRQHRSLLP